MFLLMMADGLPSAYPVGQVFSVISSLGISSFLVLQGSAPRIDPCAAPLLLRLLCLKSVDLLVNDSQKGNDNDNEINNNKELENYDVNTSSEQLAFFV